MLFAILSGILFALFITTLGPSRFKSIAKLTPILPLSLFIYFASHLPVIQQNGAILFQQKWVPSLGINLNFNLDGLSLLFTLLITGIGTLVFFYTTYYLKNHEKLMRFYAFLSIFMAAMLGLVLSNNLITLFIFWELTSISSFFLIGFNNAELSSRQSALTALAVTGLGGMTLLAFAVIIGQLTGTYEITELLAHSNIMSNGAHANLLLVLLCLSAFTKSAQFPFHFWLPGAMKAPTPVSTYLHSATMVKAGIYLLIRFSPHFETHPYWSLTLTTVGGITMVYAAFHTLFRTDLKGILAYSTIAALGILVFLIGIGNEYAITAALVFIIVHALYKATLFLITGIIDHQTGTRDITQLTGLGKYMIPVAVAGFIAALSSAGLPFMFGFIGKDLIYESTLHSSSNYITLTIVAVVTNILMVFAGAVVGIKPFIGKRDLLLPPIQKPNPVLWIPAIILAALSLLFGCYPALIDQMIIAPTLKQLNVVHNPLKIWHGFNTVLLLSIVTLVAGSILFYIFKPKHNLERWIKQLEFISPKSIFSYFVILFDNLGMFFTSTLQNGYLRNYVLILVLSFTSVLLYHTATSPLNFIDFNNLLSVGINDIVIICMMFFAILFSVFSRSRLSAIAGLGVVGYSMCFIFVFYSAPDLAMTQFTIDTLTVILFVLVVYRLPKYLKLSNTKFRIRDGIIALSLGCMITLIVLEVMNESPIKHTTEFYTDNAYLLAKGKNIVNVILVDFRGFDTFIEIVVLSIAAIGVFGLLKLHIKRK
jgi:multicomponent Na+:H+ antiporter subunit A